MMCDDCGSNLNQSKYKLYQEISNDGICYCSVVIMIYDLKQEIKKLKQLLKEIK